MTSPIFPGQQPWSREAAATLLDMSGKLPGFAAIGARQLDAAVALHRMLITQGSAYLADEVGMGKTYVALAVVALFRHLQPGFRVLYLAPSQNVLQKWHGRELPAFIRNNVRAPDMRVQGPAGLSPAASTACLRADDWLQAAVTEPSTLDVFLPLSALSFPLTGDASNWYARVKDMAARAGLSVDLRGVREKTTYKDKAAGVINRAIPRYDLVIIDEAHLLKGGAGKSASDRARFLARALGAAGHGGGDRRFGAALLLSGTPFDRDLMQLARQFELFAQPELQIAPHQHIAALAARRNAGGSWSEIQAGLKPYMIRRVQKLDVGDTSLSRNQYRTELRAGAGISLARDTRPEALRQRLFTAVVQKRLIEHLDGENEGRFPMAMFSSWEAYAPPAATGRAAAARRDQEADEDGEGAPGSNDALDVGKEANAPQDARAVDGNLMETLVAGYRDVFGEAPPHPKLEAESRRLGQEAFGEGHKQLVFVRRLKSVDDLYVRLNEAYNTWLGNYLQAEGMPGCPGPLLDACRKAAGDTARDADQTPAPAAAAALRALGPGEGEDDPPAHMDTLFSWFFSGTLDRAGKAFADRHGLPPPDLLRARLRDPERLESIIGELDWRNFAADHSPALPDIPLPELAERASRLPGPAGVLGRYRRLQLAWAQCQAEVLAPLAARPFRLLEAHLKELLIGPNPLHERIDASAAASLLSLPTVGLALYRRQPGAEADLELGTAVLPAWRSLWQALMSTDADERELSARLRALDLQREVLFALLRLDHPFIDLYLGWLGAPRDDARAGARALVDRLVAVCGRRGADTGFGTGSILRNLADAWEQIAKTNFAEFLKGSNRIERARWRLEIQRHFARLPVEWASGQNTDSRAAIARRFRMPGYPMVLVATSVLQEGEDLHVCCDRVTHFGISGSPIGIEQKNGRVDRIGSRAQRRLLDQHPVADAGIRVRFPHLSESLEWYQIRDLSQSINDYLHSMHEVGASQALEDISLATTMANRNPIPPLLTQHLSSPFEPEVGEGADSVTRVEVEARLDESRLIIDHANALLSEVARGAGFTPDPGRPDCFRHEGSNAQLSLQPAHMTGELTILASRPLDAHEQPAWLAGGRLSDGPPGPDALQALGADPRRKHALHSVDGGLSLRVHAACFARGEAELDRSEIEDLLGRIGISLPCQTATARPEPDALIRVIQALLDAGGSDEFQWKPGKKPTRHQIRSRGRRITLELRERWIVATRLIEAHPDPAPANLLRRTLWRNASPSGPDFFYTTRGEIKARMVHPLADLGASELACILRELVAVPVQEPPSQGRT